MQENPSNNEWDEKVGLYFVYFLSSVNTEYLSDRGT